MELIPITEKQSATLFEELKRALDTVSADDLKTWAYDSAARLPKIATRRVRNFGSLVARLWRASEEEVGLAVNAWRQDRIGKHVGERTAAAIDTSIDFSKSAVNIVQTVGKLLIDDPKKHAPGILALALGFIAGSGGFDGDGGIPDTDFVILGPGAHRSMFTHSIIAGIVVEGSILAIADLAGVVCKQLPVGERSELWDQLSAAKDQIANQLSMGVSLGIAYHLAVDATIQPAPYKDLPWSMPIEAHQFLFGLNAAVEVNDALDRGTTGTRIVSAVSDRVDGIRALTGRMFRS